MLLESTYSFLFWLSSPAWSRFVWGDGPPRLSWTLLTAPKQTGGLEVPDFLAYYKATLLTNALHWHLHGDTKPWVGLEQEVLGTTVVGLPWLAPMHRLTDQNPSPHTTDADGAGPIYSKTIDHHVTQLYDSFDR